VLSDNESSRVSQLSVAITKYLRLSIYKEEGFILTSSIGDSNP
jgi:hypothetical protein